MKQLTRYLGIAVILSSSTLMAGDDIRISDGLGTLARQIDQEYAERGDVSNDVSHMDHSLSSGRQACSESREVLAERMAEVDAEIAALIEEKIEEQSLADLQLANLAWKEHQFKANEIVLERLEVQARAQERVAEQIAYLKAVKEQKADIIDAQVMQTLEHTLTLLQRTKEQSRN